MECNGSGLAFARRDEREKDETGENHLKEKREKSSRKQMRKWLGPHKGPSRKAQMVEEPMGAQIWVPGR